jgi:type IV pilus assembly protein PilB
MISLNRLTRKKLGEILVEQGLLTEQQVQDGLRLQHQTGMMLGECLVANKLISEDKIAATLVGQFGIPFLVPTRYKIPKDLLEIFDPSMMRRFQFVPVDMVGSVLVIAIAGMISEDILKQIETQTGCTLQVYLTRMSEIGDVLKAHGL